MKQKLLDELMEVSEEEQKYLDGQGDIERQLYVKEKIEEIDRELRYALFCVYQKICHGALFW